MISTKQQAWRRTLSNALIITRREMRDSVRDWRIITPIIFLTFFFPLLAQSAASWISSFLSQYGAEFVGDQFIPLLLMIVGFFPISISLVIALETFVGEKERLSLEPLLSTPLTNTELYIGKMLAAMIPPLLTSFGGMSFYLITLYLRDADWKPPFAIIVQIFVLTIVQALVMVAGAVVVSSQATTTRSANLLASFIIIPMTVIINIEVIIILIAQDARSQFGITALWIIAFGMLIVTILLLRVGNAIFNREELLGRMIDELNLRAIIKKIGQHIRAIDDDMTPAHNIMDWYRQAIPHALTKIRVPMILTIIVFIAYFFIGIWIGTLPQFQLPLDLNTENGSIQALSRGDLNATQGQLSPFWIFSNNVQLLAIAFVLSVISFGVAAYIIVPLVMIVLGYIVAIMLPLGFGKLLIMGILPHGIFEMTAVIIATASMVYVGASITKPPQNYTVGQAWLAALGIAIRLFLGLVIPLLIIAALIESSLTITLVQQALTN